MYPLAQLYLVAYHNSFTAVYRMDKILNYVSVFRVIRYLWTRYGMHPFAGNYSKDRRFARTEWLCYCKKAREEESHLIAGNCEIYGEIRAKYDSLNNDMDLVNFFNEVLAKRQEIEEKEAEKNW